MGWDYCEALHTDGEKRDRGGENERDENEKGLKEKDDVTNGEKKRGRECFV